MCIRLLFWTKIDPSQQKPTWVNKCSYFVLQKATASPAKNKRRKMPHWLVKSIQAQNREHKRTLLRSIATWLHITRDKICFKLWYKKISRGSPTELFWSDKTQTAGVDIRKCIMWGKNLSCLFSEVLWQYSLSNIQIPLGNYILHTATEDGSL